MASNGQYMGTRAVPSLVQICQRVASAHVENMSSLGDNIRIDLVRPILQNCPAEALVRLENATPEICCETPEMWKALCFRSFPLLAQQQYSTEQPESWREAYFNLRDFEKHRLDAVAAKLLVKRQEERKRKEDAQIKFTDKLPPPKRTRGSSWGTSQPKTLFQKTRSDAAKFHKGIYGARTITPAQAMKANRLPAGPSNVRSSQGPERALPPTDTSSFGSTTGTRVTVTSIPKRRGPTSPEMSIASKPGSTSSNAQFSSFLTSSPSIRAGPSHKPFPARGH
ncbi:hypothetical protein BDW22DRAFT_1358482 [Trametopsis cervina]|nr:hypothetical protein BDW22DRAFT_1358482 [Trametopsis cervina]